MNILGFSKIEPNKEIAKNPSPNLNDLKTRLKKLRQAKKRRISCREIILQHGSSPHEDLVNLWKRMVFNIMISNVDDHLRNHGFLYDGTSGWKLSPVYDLEPTPTHRKPRILHTRIDLYDGTASLELANEVAREFGVDAQTARKIAREVGLAVKDWRKDAAGLGISKEEIEFMSSAFDHSDLRQSLK